MEIVNNKKIMREEKEEFGELIKFTLSGYVGGLVLGFLLDRFGLQRSGVGQWVVRTLSGEGETLFEGIYVLRQRRRQAQFSLAIAYGWGKIIGLIFPWIIDWLSRFMGLNVYGWQGFYIPYFYALSDQIGASISGLFFYYRQERFWIKALKSYFQNPVMLASFLIILLVPIGLLSARLVGFAPTTQVFTALETIAANLCWLPPLIGWLKEKRG